MVLSWRFYYFDLDRINASMEKNLCTEAISEEYTKVWNKREKEKSELKPLGQAKSRKKCLQKNGLWS